MKTNFKRYYVCHIGDGYVVLDNENCQKLVFGGTKDGKDKTEAEANNWADNENQKAIAKTSNDAIR